VVDAVHRLVELEVLDHVVVDELERVVAQVLEVLQRAGLEVVDADDAVPLAEQVLAQVGAEKPGSAGNYSARHGEDGIGDPGRIRAFRPCLTKSLRRLLHRRANFHLSGPGVNATTAMRYRGSATLRVRLSRGTYRYGSDRAGLTKRLPVR